MDKPTSTNQRIDGAELLGEDGKNIVENQRILTEADFKRIKYLKAKNRIKKEEKEEKEEIN